jgi:hypothetical protein
VLGSAGQPISRIHELIEIMAAGRRPDTKCAGKMLASLSFGRQAH